MHWIKTASGTINAVVDGKPYSIATDHPHYTKILQAIRSNDESAFITHADLPKKITSFVSGRVQVKDCEVYFDGHKVESDSLIKRIQEYIEKGQSPLPLINFLDRVRQNPSNHVNTRLFPFLENNDIKITPEGMLLGYKCVRDDWMDFRTGTFDNHIGNVCQMERRMVSDDFAKDCESGLHIGSINYAQTFEPNKSHRIIIVEFDPADVVSVPIYAGHTKLRACKYRVIQEYGKALDESPVYTSQAPVQPVPPEPVKPAAPLVDVTLATAVLAPPVVDEPNPEDICAKCDECRHDCECPDGFEKSELCADCGCTECDCDEHCPDCHEHYDDCQCDDDEDDDEDDSDLEDEDDDPFLDDEDDEDDEDDTCPECGEYDCVCEEDDDDDDSDLDDDDEEE